MAYSTLPIAGINLAVITPSDFVYTNGSTLENIPAFGPIGAETFASDGKRYAFAQAAATIPAGTTACTVNATTFQVTATGGSYVSPAESMVSGDYGWFGVTSV
jgi:hypothetical protein